MLRRNLCSEIKGWLDGPYKDAPAIRGARQVGKNYLMKHFLQENRRSEIMSQDVTSSTRTLSGA